MIKLFSTITGALLGLLLVILPTIIIVTVGIHHHWALHQYIAALLIFAVIDAFVVPLILGILGFVGGLILDRKQRNN